MTSPKKYPCHIYHVFFLQENVRFPNVFFPLNMLSCCFSLFCLLLPLNYPVLWVNRQAPDWVWPVISRFHLWFTGWSSQLRQRWSFRHAPGDGRHVALDTATRYTISRSSNSHGGDGWGDVCDRLYQRWFGIKILLAGEGGCGLGYFCWLDILLCTEENLMVYIKRPTF